MTVKFRGRRCVYYYNNQYHKAEKLHNICDFWLAMSTKRYLGEDVYCSVVIKMDHFFAIFVYDSDMDACKINISCIEFPKIYYLGLIIYQIFVILQGHILGG